MQVNRQAMTAIERKTGRAVGIFGGSTPICPQAGHPV